MKTKWRPFKEIDPFNPQNTLIGEICHEQGERYGQIRLTQINDEPCNRLIYSTPKMHYPFDKNGNFLFNKLKHSAIAYEKYDGTNIVAYSYYYKGKKYVTYKTRLNPVLKSGRFGNFFEMWTEILEDYYPEIPDIVMNEDEINISFELIGILNKHLILYPFRLDVRILFGIDNTNGNIILPDYFYWNCDVPVANKVAVIPEELDFPKMYNKLRDKIEANNEYLSESEVKGMEGLVIYSKEEGLWKQWKLKPETIFKLHTASGMSRKDITATCYNAFENYDEINFEIVKELLLEEFTERNVTRNEYRIKEIIEEVKEEMRFRKEIIDIYNRTGLTLYENKRELMRKMSEHFPSNKMRYVYTVINALEH